MCRLPGTVPVHTQHFYTDLSSVCDHFSGFYLQIVSQENLLLTVSPTLYLHHLRYQESMIQTLVMHGSPICCSFNVAIFSSSHSKQVYNNASLYNVNILSQPYSGPTVHAKIVEHLYSFLLSLFTFSYFYLYIYALY